MPTLYPSRRNVVHNDDETGAEAGSQANGEMVGPYGAEYGNPRLGNGEWTFPHPDEVMWMQYNCREYLKLEQEKALLDNADEYRLDSNQIKSLQDTLLKRILGRREHILNDPLYQFLQHVAGTMGNTTVTQLYETDENSRAERIQLLYDQLTTGGRGARENRSARARMWGMDEDDSRVKMNDSIRAYAVAELEKSAVVAIDTPTLTAMVRDVNISGRIQMRANVFQATQKLMTELSQKAGCREIGKAPLMQLLERGDTRLVTLLGEITAYNLMASAAAAARPPQGLTRAPPRRSRTNWTRAATTRSSTTTA